MLVTALKMDNLDCTKIKARGHCHQLQLGLAYGCETWAYPINTLLATVVFLLLLLAFTDRKLVKLLKNAYQDVYSNAFPYL